MAARGGAGVRSPRLSGLWEMMRHSSLTEAGPTRLKLAITAVELQLYPAVCRLPQKCVPWQKLLTWLKLACPISRLLPHHTRTGLGTDFPYALRRSVDHRRRRPPAGGCGERSRRNELGLVEARARFRVTLLSRVGGAQFF